MNTIQALIVVIVLIIVVWAVRTILGMKNTGELCVPSISNSILPANATTIPCCQDRSGQCDSTVTSAWGKIALVPEKLSALCPVQALTPDQYNTVLSSPAGNQPIPVNMSMLGELYDAGKDCGSIQAIITRLCYPVYEGSADPSKCNSGFAAVQGGASQTVSCPSGELMQVTRRVLIPGNFSKATCQGSCCYVELPTGSPVNSITINANKDATRGAAALPSILPKNVLNCSGQALDELLYYQCLKSS